MITCQRVDSLTYDYVTAALPEGDLWDFEAHLRACPACARGVRAYLRVLDLSGRLPPPPLPPATADWVRSALAERDWH